MTTFYYLSNIKHTPTVSANQFARMIYEATPGKKSNFYTWYREVEADLSDAWKAYTEGTF